MQTTFENKVVSPPLYRIGWECNIDGLWALQYATKNVCCIIFGSASLLKINNGHRILFALACDGQVLFMYVMSYSTFNFQTNKKQKTRRRTHAQLLGRSTNILILQEFFRLHVESLLVKRDRTKKASSDNNQRRRRQTRRRTTTRYYYLLSLLRVLLIQLLK
jgi:hypothetical protein